MKLVGDFVYVLNENNISYGTIIKKTTNYDTNKTKYMIDCEDDLYFNINENEIFSNKKDLFKQINLLLKRLIK